MGGGSIVGTIVGAAAGFVTGGPVGAVYGAGLGASAGSTLIDQPRAAKKQAEAQNQALAQQAKAQKAEQRIAEIRNQRSRVAQARQARQQRAAAAARAINVAGASPGGISGMSPAFGTMGSIQSQLGTNIGTIGRQEALAGQASAFNISATDYMSQANEYGRDLAFSKSIAGIGSTIFGQFATAGVNPTVPSTSSANVVPTTGMNTAFAAPTVGNF